MAGAEEEEWTEEWLAERLATISAGLDRMQRTVDRLAEHGGKRDAALRALCDNAQVIYDDDDNEIEYVTTAALRAVLDRPITLTAAL
jgi:hypothetical protein